MKMCHSKACSSMSFYARTCPCNHHSGWKIEQFQPSLRLISALWFLFGIIKFCWFWNFAHGNGIQLYILFSIWLSSMLVHASAIVLFLCCVQFHCVNTLHIFLLCYWWILGCFPVSGRFEQNCYDLAHVFWYIHFSLGMCLEVELL